MTTDHCPHCGMQKYRPGMSAPLPHQGQPAAELAVQMQYAAESRAAWARADAERERAYAQYAAAQATAERLTKALAELVACKDLRDAIDCQVWPNEEQRERARRDYAYRKPLAWSAARAALAASDSAKDKETGNG